MSKIEKLTTEQEARIPEFIEKWLKIGLTTAPFNPDEARKICDPFYTQILKRKKPNCIIILESPYKTWLATCLVAINQVWSQVEDQVGSQVWSQIRSQVWSQVWSQVEDQVGSQVRSQVGSQVWSQVEDQIRSQVEDQIRSQVEDFIWPYQDGNYFASLFGFYDFFRDVCKINMPSIYNIWETTSRLSLMYSIVKDGVEYCILAQHPTEIHMENRVLHNDNGMSVRYQDGWGIYSLHGVRVPAGIVETPADKLDASLILKEQNAEVRREIVRKIGIERVCKDLQAEIMDKQGLYQLLNLNLGDGRKRPYLKMLNPSTETWHLEGVPPGTCSVNEAMVWRNLGIQDHPSTLT